MNIAVIIPALDEAASVGHVVESIPRTLVRDVVVVDNGSTDDTAGVATRAGALAVREPRRGYGRACLSGIAALAPDVDVVAFMDADGSDDPTDLAALLSPITRGEADLVIGSRVTGEIEAGALTPQQRVGNLIAATWLRARFRLAATDLGPFRAIRRDMLGRLGMEDEGYGWTVEMQIKAARQGLRYAELPVRYRRRRAGRSKVSGTVRGVAGATVKILGLLAYYDFIRRA